MMKAKRNNRENRIEREINKEIEKEIRAHKIEDEIHKLECKRVW